MAIEKRRMLRWLTNSELEKTRKEAVVAYSRYYPSILLGELRKSKKISGSISGLQKEI
jgi:hypothetical protein